MPEVPAPRIDDAISEAELQDLQTLAQQSGISLQDVIERYAWNDNFAMAVQEIREQFPGAFAGAEIVDANHAWIAFADHVPIGAYSVVDIFAQHSPDVAVEFRAGVRYTEAALVEAVERVHLAVYRLPEVRDAITSYDVEAREIRTTVLLADSETELDEVQAVAEDSLASVARASVLEGFAATVVESSSDVLGRKDSSVHHMGGEDISCTSGFGTRADSHTSGIRGISTAGHCSNSLSDDGNALTFRGEHEGAHGDFQWHNGPDAETDDFYSVVACRPRCTRATSPVLAFRVLGNRFVGMAQPATKTASRFGSLMSALAAYVISFKWVSVCAGGDSGGPVYWANTAYGLHMGWMHDPWPFDRDLFS